MSGGGVEKPLFLGGFYGIFRQGGAVVW